MLSGQGRVGRGCKWEACGSAARALHLPQPVPGLGPVGPVLSIPPLLTGLGLLRGSLCYNIQAWAQEAWSGRRTRWGSRA